MLDNPLVLPTADIAVDLGTSFTRVAVRGRGVVMEQPSVVAVQASSRGREVLAAGEDAKRMLGRTGREIQVHQPLKDGVIADFEAAEQMLRTMLAQVTQRRLTRPRVLMCVPTETTEVERRAVQESARAAGSRDVLLVPTPLAAAIGAGLSIEKAQGSLVVDVGGGTTDAAVLSLGGIVVCRTARVAGDAMDRAIAGWMRRHHSLLIGARTAEELKQTSGAAVESMARGRRVRGRDLAEGVPREVVLEDGELARALAEPVARVRQVVLDVLAETPPELAADIVDRGIVLCGGGSRLRGLEHVLRDAVDLPVIVAETPERCAALGAHALLQSPALFQRVTSAA